MLRSQQIRAAAIVFFLSGATAIVYEIVWIRLLSLQFGNTAYAMSTVLSTYMAGLAAGAFASENLRRPGRRACLTLYGVAEILIGVWAALVPWLMSVAEPLLRGLYQDGYGRIGPIAAVRAAIGSLAILPAAAAMGATLPLVAAWLADEGALTSAFYSLNLAGATAGALISGFALLPYFGFHTASLLASIADVLMGVVAISVAGRAPPEAIRCRAAAGMVNDQLLPDGGVAFCAFVSGFVSLLFEVAWARAYGLLLGPTASTAALVLAVFLGGLATGGGVASRIRRRSGAWLCGGWLACATALGWSLAVAAFSPAWIAIQVQAHSGDYVRLELMKLLLLSVTLLPLTATLGLVFPLTMRGRTRSIGTLYATNTAGCIAGSLAAGWVAIPHIGTEATLLAGGVLAMLAAAWIAWKTWPRFRFPIAAGCAVLFAGALLFPAWNMAAMTAGVYKYAPYYAEGARAASDASDLVSVREGVSSTVAVRRSGDSLVMAIDGKVDASDSGGDLLTEKLLAHLPMLAAREAKKVCIVGLASGVTAGAILKHPVDSLDIVELSPEVAGASHYFDGVNGRPLADPRTRLIVNDGRNHLTLTDRTYDLIVSEPSNPWIAGMDSVFTEDFFRIARSRLRSGGLLAQWFHIYNMPLDDLRSLVRAFTSVFPSAALWKLNDGDVLLTGLGAGDIATGASAASAAVREDLASVGLSSPAYLYDLYVIGGSELARFARGAQPNTDDFPVLEFHGQRDMHAQTDIADESALLAAADRMIPPEPVVRAREQIKAPERLAIAAAFEKAESLRAAFRNYSAAHELDPGSVEAVAGMDRCARLPEQREAVAQVLGLPRGVSTPEERTAWARDQDAAGNTYRANFVLEEIALASPHDPAAAFNSGVFSLGHLDYRGALDAFSRAISIDSRYIPAYEGIAQTYAEQHQYQEAEKWSRRILEIEPDHQAARRSLAALAQLKQTRK